MKYVNGDCDKAEKLLKTLFISFWDSWLSQLYAEGIAGFCNIIINDTQQCQVTGLHFNYCFLKLVLQRQCIKRYREEMFHESVRNVEDSITGAKNWTNIS